MDDQDVDVDAVLARLLRLAPLDEELVRNVVRSMGLKISGHVEKNTELMDRLRRFGGQDQ